MSDYVLKAVAAVVELHAGAEVTSVEVEDGEVCEAHLWDEKERPTGSKYSVLTSDGMRWNLHLTYNRVLWLAGPRRDGAGLPEDGEMAISMTRSDSPTNFGVRLEGARPTTGKGQRD